MNAKDCKAGMLWQPTLNSQWGGIARWEGHVQDSWEQMTATMPTKVIHCSYPKLGNAVLMLVLDNVNDIPYMVMVLGDLLCGTSQKKASPSSQSWFSGEHGEFITHSGCGAQPIGWCRTQVSAEYSDKFLYLYASSQRCPGFEIMFYHWSDLQKSGVQ